MFALSASRAIAGHSALQRGLFLPFACSQASLSSLQRLSAQPHPFPEGCLVSCILSLCFLLFSHGLPGRLVHPPVAFFLRGSFALAVCCGFRRVSPDPAFPLVLRLVRLFRLVLPFSGLPGLGTHGETLKARLYFLFGSGLVCCCSLVIRGRVLGYCRV